MKTLIIKLKKHVHMNIKPFDEYENYYLNYIFLNLILKLFNFKYNIITQFHFIY